MGLDREATHELPAEGFRLSPVRVVAFHDPISRPVLSPVAKGEPRIQCPRDFVARVGFPAVGVHGHSWLWR